MFILFDSAAIVKPNTFAAELNPPAVHAPVNPGRKTAPYSAVDQAFQAGWTAARESNFEDVLPPAHFGPAEVKAFNEGAVEGWKSAEFDDPSDVRDWDSDLDAELNRMAEERSWQFSYEHGGYNHS